MQLLAMLTISNQFYQRSANRPDSLLHSAMKVELHDQSIYFEGLVSMISDYVTEVHVEGVSLLGNDDSALTLQKKIRGTEPFHEAFRQCPQRFVH
jgi:hypothetical protein